MKEIDQSFYYAVVEEACYENGIKRAYGSGATKELAYEDAIYRAPSQKVLDVLLHGNLLYIPITESSHYAINSGDYGAISEAYITYPSLRNFRSLM